MQRQLLLHQGSLGTRQQSRLLAVALRRMESTFVVASVGVIRRWGGGRLRSVPRLLHATVALPVRTFPLP